MPPTNYRPDHIHIGYGENNICSICGEEVLYYPFNYRFILKEHLESLKIKNNNDDDYESYDC